MYDNIQYPAIGHYPRRVPPAPQIYPSQSVIEPVGSVHRLSAFYMYGGSSHPEMGTLLSQCGACYIVEIHSISDRPAGLGFPHGARWCRPRGQVFSSTLCCSCECMEVFTVREDNLSWPGDVDSPNLSQTVTESVGLGFDTVRGGIDPGGRYAFIFDPGITIYPPRVMLTLRTPANTYLEPVGGVSTPGGAVSSRGITCYVPGSSKL